MRQLLVFLAFFACITTFASNQTDIPESQQQTLFKQAQQLTASKQYTQAIRIYQTLATTTSPISPKAQYALGEMYLKGLGVTANINTAFKLMNQAATANYPPAQYQLGVMIKNGDGTIKDPQQGFIWLQKAADADFSKAQYDVGLDAAVGNFVPKNPALAYQYLLPFAKKGDIKALMAVAQISLAPGKSHDIQQAITFLTQAAKQKNEQAQYVLALIYYQGKFVKKDDYQAFYWFTESAKQKNPNAMYYLALMYLQGKGTTASLEKATQYFDQASHAYNLDPKIAYQLAQRYFKGNTVSQNTQTGINLLIVAASAGNKQAQLDVAQRYYQQDDIANALTWFKKAAKNGEAQAQYYLGYIYYSGTGGQTIDYQTSLKWYTEAANQDQAEAMYMTGFQYYAGQGIPKNATTAMQWFKKSALLGNGDAQIMVATLYQKGQGVKQNSAKALAWLEVATTSSDKTIVTKANKYIKQLQPQLSQGQVNKAKQLAGQYYQQIRSNPTQS